MNGPEKLLPSPIESAPVPVVHNHTAFPSQYFQMMDATDEIFHVMVARMTYDLTQIDASGYPALDSKQEELVDSDQFYDVENISSVIQESDYAPFKPKCDVLLINAHAWAPPRRSGKRKPMSRFPAGLQVETSDGTQLLRKLVTVTGPRTLSVGPMGSYGLSEPLPVLSVPIRYEQAFGGTNQWWTGWPAEKEADQRMDIDLHAPRNPIGAGLIDSMWQGKTGLRQFPAPQVEVFDKRFTAAHAETAARSARNPDAEAAYSSVGFGAIGRWWQPRRTLAGSYDEIWKATRWPRLPGDFDFAYWNAAPDDQQIDYPTGGEQVKMVNLVAPEHSADGSLAFAIPKNNLMLLMHLDAGIPLFKPMNVDTVVIDLQAMQLSLVARCAVAAASGIDAIELGTWDIEGARKRNAGVRNFGAVAGEPMHGE
jgi:hypothetical protein